MFRVRVFVAVFYCLDGSYQFSNAKYLSYSSELLYVRSARGFNLSNTTKFGPNYSQYKIIQQLQLQKVLRRQSLRLKKEMTVSRSGFTAG